MNCRKCGAEIPAGEVFCPKCGAEVQLVPDYNSIEYFVNEKKEQEELKRRREETEKKDQRKKNHSTLKAILITLLVICLIVAALFITKAVIDNRNFNDYDFQMQAAQKSYDSSNYSDALVYVIQALRLKPDAYEAKSLQADIMLKENDSQEAEQILLELITIKPDDANNYSRLIGIYEDSADYNKIKTLLADASDSIKNGFSDYIAKAPSFDPEEGSYKKQTTVTITTDSGKIYYTDDGSDPTTDSKEYSAPIQLSEGRTEIRAIAVNSKNITSDTAIAVYNVSYPAPDSPKILTASGTYKAGTTITVSVPTGCTAYYAFDAVANKNGTVYTKPVEMTAGTHVFSVVAVNKNGKVSAPSSETYIVS